MIEVLQFGCKFAVNIFDIYIKVKLLNVLFKNKLYYKRFLYTAISINLIAMLLLEYYTPYVWVNFITATVLIFMLVCCYQTTIWKKLFTTLIINVLLSLSEMIIAILIKLDNLSFLTKASNGESIALFLSRIVFWIIVIIVQKIVDKDNPNKLSLKAAVLEILVFLSMIFELLYLCIVKEDNITINSVVLFTSEITFYLLIYLQDCLMELFASNKQASLIAQEKEYYQKEAEIIQQKQELERQFRHDLNNRLQILNDIAERGNISELKNYLSEIDTKQKEHTVYSNTENLIIDSIINSKLQYASEKRIKVNADIILPAHIKVNTDDMVIILGNLLDNAIEACEKVNTDKYIDILMRYEDGCIILNIKNSFNQVINRAGNEFITLKKDKALHGLGIKSVKNTIDTYNGIIEFSSKGNEFSVDIILYL